jgi:1,4-dihydroxy-2-naphthoate octaprenyltransferase
MHSKHTRDISAHERAGLVSLAVLLGQQKSYFFFSFLLFSPYFIFLYWVMQYSVAFGLPLITIFYAFPLEKSFRETRGTKSISQKLTYLNLTIGSLHIIGCYLATNIPFQ